MKKVTVNRNILIEKALQLIANHSVTAYEIEQNTDLTAVGVQKFINGETKRPNQSTLKTIISYIEDKYLKISSKTVLQTDNIIPETLTEQESEFIRNLISSKREALMEDFYFKTFLTKLLKDKELEVYEYLHKNGKLKK